MLFPVWLSHVSRACTALSKHGVGVEPPFWPDCWDRGRACARGGTSSSGVTCMTAEPRNLVLLRDEGTYPDWMLQPCHLSLSVTLRSTLCSSGSPARALPKGAAARCRPLTT